MQVQIFGAQLSRGTMITDDKKEFPYNAVKFNVLSDLAIPRNNYVGKEVGIMIGDGALWESKVQPLAAAGKIPGRFDLTLGQRFRQGKLETVIMDLVPASQGVAK